VALGNEQEPPPLRGIHEALRDAPFETHDKGGAVKSEDPPVLPPRLRRKTAYVAELPTSISKNGATIYNAK